MSYRGASRQRFSEEDRRFMQRALTLARKGYGLTSPNPMVGAVITSRGKIVGEGWHHRAGEAHAEINAIAAAKKKKVNFREAVLYVTLEPCSTFGRTPPCVEAITALSFPRVVIAAIDPNPRHAGGGIEILKRAKIKVETGLLAEEAAELNEAFNHWIVTGEPWIVLKAGATLDGKIATRSGESKWITSDEARREAMRMRLGSDAILVGINTVLRDNPSLTLRAKTKIPSWKKLRRVVLDREAQVPLDSNLVSDEQNETTTVFISSEAPRRRVEALRKTVQVVEAPLVGGKLDLEWISKFLGAEKITSLLVEGGGETHAQFLQQGLGNRVAFFYAPKILGGRTAPKTVAGNDLEPPLKLENAEWRKLGPDLLLTACLSGCSARR